MQYLFAAVIDGEVRQGACEATGADAALEAAAWFAGKGGLDRRAESAPVHVRRHASGRLTRPVSWGSPDEEWQLPAGWIAADYPRNPGARDVRTLESPSAN